MFRRHPKLLFLLPIVTLILLPIALTKWVGGDHGAWSVLSMFLLPVSMVPVVRRVDRLEVNLKQADHKRRLEPVQQMVDRCWVMLEEEERDYRLRLVTKIHRALNVAPKPDAPLLTGTKVDAYMEFEGEDWFITIKRGLDSQKRLILQGEIEDIILHAPHHDRDLWICVVVGVSEPENANEQAHLEALYKYVMQRSIVAGHHRQQNGGRRIRIKVMLTIIPSTPLTPEELCELDLAAA